MNLALLVIADNLGILAPLSQHTVVEQGPDGGLLRILIICLINETKKKVSGPSGVRNVLLASLKDVIETYERLTTRNLKIYTMQHFILSKDIKILRS